MDFTRMSNYTPIKLAFNVFEPCKKSSDVDIILMHGITSSKETWNEIAQKLADESGKRIFALDTRNHGDSGWDDLLNYDVMVNDLIAFIEEHCCNTPILIGHSMGGKVAMTLGLLQPEKVHALIIEDMPPTATTDTMRSAIRSWIKFMQNILQLIPRDMDLSEAVQFVGKELLKNMPRKIQRHHEYKERFISTLQLIKKEGGFSWKMNTDALERYTLDKSLDLEGFCLKPALFLYGASSPLNVFRAKDKILKMFPNVQLCEFENTRHDIHMERPEKFCKEVLQFLKDLAH